MNQNSGCLLRTAKEPQGTLWNDGDVLYFDQDVSYMSIHVCQNSPKCTVKIFTINCINYIYISFITVVFKIGSFLKVAGVFFPGKFS